MIHSRAQPTSPDRPMTFCTGLYQREHGKAPRGRGSWAFCPWAQRNAHDYLKHTIFSPGGMTLTEAKRWAKAKIQKLRGAGTSLTSPCMSDFWVVMP